MHSSKLKGFVDTAVRFIDDSFGRHDEVAPRSEGSGIRLSIYSPVRDIAALISQTREFAPRLDDRQEAIDSVDNLRRELLGEAVTAIENIKHAKLNGAQVELPPTVDVPGLFLNAEGPVRVVDWIRERVAMWQKEIWDTLGDEKKHLPTFQKEDLKATSLVAAAVESWRDAEGETGTLGIEQSISPRFRQSLIAEMRRLRLKKYIVLGGAPTPSAVVSNLVYTDEAGFLHDLMVRKYREFLALDLLRQIMIASSWLEERDAA